MRLPLDGISQPTDSQRMRIGTIEMRRSRNPFTEILAQKDYSTYRAYALATRQFRESCLKKIYLDEINRADLLNTITFLRKLKNEEKMTIERPDSSEPFPYTFCSS